MCCSFFYIAFIFIYFYFTLRFPLAYKCLEMCYLISKFVRFPDVWILVNPIIIILWSEDLTTLSFTNFTNLLIINFYIGFLNVSLYYLYSTWSRDHNIYKWPSTACVQLICKLQKTSNQLDEFTFLSFILTSISLL